MAVITLTTDWNEDDYYIGSIKGILLSQFPDCTVIDISHKIKPFNILEAAFILRNTYYRFPPDTIHIIGVDTVCNEDQGTIVVKANGHYFIGNNNGVFSLIFQESPEWIIELEKMESNFPESNLYIKTIKSLLDKSDISKIGTKLNEFQKKVPLRATIDESVITGSIIHVDSYKNAITNITKDIFTRVGHKRPFELYVQSNSYKIRKISKTYTEVSQGDLVALFNSLGLLEIAINKGNAADLLNLSTNSSIRIKFM